MPLPMRKPHHFVLERRTVSWADSANLAVEERRLPNIRSNEIVHSIGRVEHVTRDLIAIDCVGLERKRHRRAIAALHREPREVDALPIESRWSACLQASPLESE